MRTKKTCRVCKEEHDITNFSKMKDKSTGRFYSRAYCKECGKAYRRFWSRRKRSEENPNEHWDCPKCEFFWKKSFGQFCSMCGFKGIPFQEGRICKI